MSALSHTARAASSLLGAAKPVPVSVPAASTSPAVTPAVASYGEVAQSALKATQQATQQATQKAAAAPPSQVPAAAPVAASAPAAAPAAPPVSLPAGTSGVDAQNLADHGPVVAAVLGVADALADAGRDAGQAISHGAEELGSTAQQALDKVNHGALALKKAMGDYLHQAESWTQEAAEEATEAFTLVSDGFNAVAGEINGVIGLGMAALAVPLV